MGVLYTSETLFQLLPTWSLLSQTCFTIKEEQLNNRAKSTVCIEECSRKYPLNHLATSFFSLENQKLQSLEHKASYLDPCTMNLKMWNWECSKQLSNGLDARCKTWFESFLIIPPAAGVGVCILFSLLGSRTKQDLTQGFSPIGPWQGGTQKSRWFLSSALLS